MWKDISILAQIGDEIFHIGFDKLDKEMVICVHVLVAFVSETDCDFVGQFQSLKKKGIVDQDMTLLEYHCDH